MFYYIVSTHGIYRRPVVLLDKLVIEAGLLAGEAVHPDPADAEGVPQRGLVPEVGVNHALHRVTRHVGCGQGEETCNAIFFLS